MRTQEEQNKQPKHLLETDIEDNPYRVLLTALEHIHYDNQLTSPEVALYLRDLYYKTYLYDIGKQDVENAFGTVIYREAEDPYKHTPLKYILIEYTRCEIKKFFGYNFTEYLELNMIEAEILKEQSEKMKQELIKAMSDIQKDTNKQMSNRTSKNNHITSYTNDLEEELFG